MPYRCYILTFCFATTLLCVYVYPVHAQEIGVAGENLQIVAWQPVKDGLLAISGSRSGTIWLYNSQLELVTTLSLEENYSVYVLRWSPDGSRLAVRGGWAGAGKIFVWEQNSLTTFTSLAIIDLTNGASGLVLAWSPDNEHIATVFDLRAEVWNTITGEFVHRIGTPMGVEATGNVTSIAWSPDGTKIAIGTDGYFVHIVDTSNYVLLTSIAANDDFFVDAVAWNSDGTKLAVLIEGAIKIFAAINYEKVAVLEHTAAISNLLVWQDDNLVVAGEGAEIIIWCTSPWKIYERIPTNDPLIASISWNYEMTKLAYGGYTYGKITLVQPGH